MPPNDRVDTRCSGAILTLVRRVSTSFPEPVEYRIFGIADCRRATGQYPVRTIKKLKYRNIITISYTNFEFV